MKVLFLCTGNSCRSQMAEGFARQLGAEAASAGVQPTDAVHPLAVKVMAEKGIDLSGHRPKPLDDVLSQDFNVVVTVCGNAEERCPAFPGRVLREHWPLPDPAKATGTEDEVLAVFRQARDEIEERVGRLVSVRAGASTE